MPITSTSDAGVIGTLTSATDFVQFPTSPLAAVAVSIQGTFALIAQFEGTLDNINWFSVSATPLISNGPPVTLVAGGGNWVVSVGGLAGIRVRCSAWTSGAALVTLVGTYGSAPITLCPLGVWFQESVTALTAAQTFTGASRSVGAASGIYTLPVANFRAMVFNDQSCTIRVEASFDNTTWFATTTNTAVAANLATILTVPVVAGFYRCVVVNGGTLAANTKISSSFLQA